jgi:mannose/fructose/N-acetylgalactosamine-specific phosphotransferase system component IIB
MPVVLARVDDRLLHGQVVEGWTPYVQAEKIVVVSDTVCLEKDRCQLMKLIVPDHIELTVVPLKGLGDLLKKSGESRILLLFAGLDDVLSVLESGVALDSINVGNLHNIKGGTEVTPSVYLNSKDLEAVKRLVHKGVAVEAREVPDGSSLDLASCLQEPDGSE